MTDEMLAVAEENKRKSGLENVEFLKGEIEHIPLPDNSVDVIISNCVINLSGDKDRVLRGSVPRAEARRPLRRLRRGRPRGRAGRHQEEHGAVGRLRGRRARRLRVHREAREGRLRRASASKTTRVYSIDDARTFLAGEGLDVDALAKDVDGTFISGFVRATKPAAAACCAPGCCN